MSTDPATDLLAPAPRHRYQANMEKVAAARWDIYARYDEAAKQSEPVSLARSCSLLGVSGHALAQSNLDRGERNSSLLPFRYTKASQLLNFCLSCLELLSNRLYISDDFFHCKQMPMSTQNTFLPNSNYNNYHAEKPVQIIVTIFTTKNCQKSRTFERGVFNFSSPKLLTNKFNHSIIYSHL